MSAPQGRRPGMVEGYLVVDQKSGLVRAFRRSVVQAFAKADETPGALVMLVRIPADQEVFYRTAEAVRPDSVPPPPDGEFVRTVRTPRKDGK